MIILNMIDDFIMSNLPSLLSAAFFAGGVYKIIQYRLNKHSETLSLYQNRICKLEEGRNEIVEIKTDIKWIKLTLEDIKKKLQN